MLNSHERTQEAAEATIAERVPVVRIVPGNAPQEPKRSKTRRKPKELTFYDRERVRKLYFDGMTPMKISKVLQIQHQKVTEICYGKVKA